MVLRTPVASKPVKQAVKQGPVAMEELVASVEELKENEFPFIGGADEMVGLPE
jgi:hypothetical protein